MFSQRVILSGAKNPKYKTVSQNCETAFFHALMSFRNSGGMPVRTRIRRIMISAQA